MHIYAWQEADGSEDGWGTIAAIVSMHGHPTSAPVPLVSRNRAVAEALFRDIAIQHGRAAGRQVRLARYDLNDVLETINPEDT